MQRIVERPGGERRQPERFFCGALLVLCLSSYHIQRAHATMHLSRKSITLGLSNTRSPVYYLQVPIKSGARNGGNDS